MDTKGFDCMSNIGNKEVFSRNLLYYIERKDKTQREVAEAIGVSPSTFNEWVNAKKYPRIDKIEKLAIYFGIQKSNLIEDKKPTDEQMLTDAEKHLLELFRHIPEEMQDVVLEMIQVSLKNRK
jgi:transcriptional regulator with XRE-family HTH domain